MVTVLKYEEDPVEDRGQIFSVVRYHSLPFAGRLESGTVEQSSLMRMSVIFKTNIENLNKAC